MIKNTDLAYAAGYIDGDGCFHISKYKNKFIASLIIVSTNKDILDWFKSQFGGTVSQSKKVIEGWKPQYHFTQRRTNAIPFIKSILPYLIEKHAEAEIFIQFCQSQKRLERIDLIDTMKYTKSSINLAARGHKSQFETTRSTITPIEEDFAYLAGFIDAECCFCIQRYKTAGKPNHIYKAELLCNNTKAPVFKWLLERFGGTINFIDRNSKDPKQRNQLQWRLISTSLAKIINRIHPFLKYKKPVCEELMKFINTILPNGGARHTEKFRESYARIIAQREVIVRNVHLLNLKGTVI